MYMCTLRANAYLETSNYLLSYFRRQIDIKSSILPLDTVYAPLFHIFLFVSLVLISLFRTLDCGAVSRTLSLGVFRRDIWQVCITACKRELVRIYEILSEIVKRSIYADHFLLGNIPNFSNILDCRILVTSLQKFFTLLQINICIPGITFNCF